MYIDGGRSNGSFWSGTFLERKFLPVNSQLCRQKKFSIWFFQSCILITQYQIDSIIFLVKARLLAWRANKMYVLLKRLQQYYNQDALTRISLYSSEYRKTGQKRLKDCVEKTQRQARKDSKAGQKRLKGRLEKTQRQAISTGKANICYRACSTTASTPGIRS